MCERDRVVALAPDDEGGQSAHQVEAVARADPLPVHVDHRAQRVQKAARAPGSSSGLSARAIACSRTPVPDPRRRSARPASESPESTRGWAASESSADAPGSSALRSSGLTSRPRPPLETSTRRSVRWGELVEELERHAAAQGVADDARPLDAHRREDVADCGGMSAERVVPPRRRGAAVADQVGSEHGVVGGHLAPVTRGVDHPVDEDDGRTAAGRSTSARPRRDDVPGGRS